MLPIVKVLAWNTYRLSMLGVGKKIILLIPQGVSFPTIPKDDPRVHIDLSKKGEHIRVGEAKIIRTREMPVGRITPDLWAMELGGGYEEEFIENAREVYGLDDFCRFSCVRLLKLEITHFEDKFVRLFSTTNPI